MQMKHIRLMCLLTTWLLLGGCTAPKIKEGELGAWKERCAITSGWKFCFLVPPSTHEDRTKLEFTEVRGSEGKSFVYGPWNYWRGTRWDGLYATVSHEAPLPASASNAQLVAWADFWDKDKYKQKVAAGASRLDLHSPYKTSVVKDARGRRWALGVHSWRELNPLYTRVNRIYVTPVGDSDLKLEVTFHCTYPHPNCSLVDRMISEVRWEKVQ